MDYDSIMSSLSEIAENIFGSIPADDDDLETFCDDADDLQNFYDQVGDAFGLDLLEDAGLPTLEDIGNYILECED